MRLERSRGGMHHLDGRLTAEDKSLMEEKLGTAHPIPAAAVAVDYPKSGERVSSREYAFRVSARSGGSVEVSIDDEAWLPCRHAVGYWWHDWSGYGDGPHMVRARVTQGKSRRSLSELRRFVVEPS